MFSEICFHHSLWGVQGAAEVHLSQRCWHALNDQFGYIRILMLEWYFEHFRGTNSDPSSLAFPTYLYSMN